MTSRPFCTALAGWAATAGPMPGAVRQEARLALLDTVACIIAGTDERQTQAAAKMSGAMPSAAGTALVLGTAAHALDFDDYEIPGSTHPSAPILGALLALAQDRAETWGRLLDAYAVGYEAIVRLGETMGYEHYALGWHATGTLGTIGSAAASARLLRLPAAGIGNAVSLAASMAAGLKGQFGTDAKALHAGLAARAGVEAAQLAEAGASANDGVFEGPYGFFARYGGSGLPGRERALAAIGRTPGILQHRALRKPWPSCAYTHRAIEAALALAGGIAVPARDIAEVAIRMPEPFFRVAGFVQPGNPNEARFSVNHCVAAALLDGAVTPASFSPAAIGRTDVRSLTARTVIDAYDPGPGLEDMSPDHPDTVAITLRDGTVLTYSVTDVFGGAQAPMSLEQLKRKFSACGGSGGLAHAILETADDQPFRLRLDRSDHAG